MQIPPTQGREERIASRHPSQNQINSDPAGQNAGIRLDSLIAWTINDKDEIACLTEMGVSGIITAKNWRPHFCRGRSRALITYLMHNDDFRHPCKESRTFRSGKCTELSPGFKSCSRNAGFSWMSKNRSLGPTTQSDKVEEYCFD